MTEIIKPEIFDFNIPPKNTNWLVENVIPLGHLCFLIAQSGTGKSFLLEWLLMCVMSGVDFLGFKTTFGDVLLIDQDTPTNVLNHRLYRMRDAIEAQRLSSKFSLSVYSMQNLSLADNSLIYAIKNSSATLVIIDSLHSVCGKLNSNKTEDMSRWATLKGECLTDNKTIVCSHHITEKLTYRLNELMDNNAHISSMGNSAIRQQTDTEYIMTSTVEDGKIDKIYIRPVAKRAAVSSKPLIVKMIEDNSKLLLEFSGYYIPELSEEEEDIYLLMQQRPGNYTVKEIKEQMGNKWGENSIRDALHSLEVKNKVVMSRNRSNLFKYRLPEITK